jgi:beta-fructofuranosidase
MNWDPWLLKDGDLYRLFYLQGVEGQTPWWIASHICGAVSTDLNHWEDLGILITPNPEQPLESGRISAGCALKENDTLYSV